LDGSETESPVITIFGSFNDLAHKDQLGEYTDGYDDNVSNTSQDMTATICGCINTTINKILRKYPFARLCLVTPTPWYSTVPSEENSYVDAIINIARLRGIPCLDLFHNSSLRPKDLGARAKFYIEDSDEATHLTAAGHKLIAPRFKAMLDTLIL
jgi:lysophospholipase L1-like esterase